MLDQYFFLPLPNLPVLLFLCSPFIPSLNPSGHLPNLEKWDEETQSHRQDASKDKCLELTKANQYADLETKSCAEIAKETESSREKKYGTSFLQ